jgi:hypothetical protein
MLALAGITRTSEQRAERMRWIVPEGGASAGAHPLDTSGSQLSRRFARNEFAYDLMHLATRAPVQNATRVAFFSAPTPD